MIKEFFNTWSTRFCDFDGSFGSQCVDLYRQYCRDVLKVPQSPVVNGAAEIWNTYLPEYFDLIPNTPLGIPRLGDIVVWNKKLNGYGHVGIFNEGGLFSFTSFDQNFPLGSPCHLQKHSYTNVIGWLRPRPPKPPRPTKPSEPLESFIYRLIYLNDVDDLKEQIDYCNVNFRAFTGGRLGVSYTFHKIDPVIIPKGKQISQDVASEVVDNQNLTQPYHGVLLGCHMSDCVSAWYATYTSFIKNIVMTHAFAPADKDALLFELKHQAVLYYDIHRGNRPYIDVYDNYSGGIEIVKKQLESLIPYVSVFS